MTTTMLATDWAGLATFVTAIFSGFAALVAAYYSRNTHGQIQSPNSETRSIGQLTTDIAKAVEAPPPSTPPPPTP